MKLEKGDLVWLGWAADTLFKGPTAEKDKQYRMQQAEILYFSGYWGVNGVGHCNNWRVRLQSGLEINAAEPFIIKIPPEEHGRREEKEDQKPVEAVSSDC